MSAMRGNRKGVFDKSGFTACSRDVGESKVTLSYLGKIKTSAIRNHRIERVGKLLLLTIAGDGIGTSRHGDWRRHISHEQKQPQYDATPASQPSFLYELIAPRGNRARHNRRSRRDPESTSRFRRCNSDLRVAGCLVP